MKKCADIDPLMTPYVDGEADSEACLEIEAHLDRCPPCRERAEAERAARTLVRSKADALVSAAPSGLRARCVGAAPGSAAQPAAVAATSEGGFSVRRWIPLSVAATAVLAVAGVFMMGQQERLQAAFAAQLAIDHEKCFHEFGVGHEPMDQETAETRLAVNHGLQVPIPATAAAEQIELVDVRSCAYDGGGMAHLLYEVEGRPVSLFMIPETRQADRALEVVNHQARLWSQGEIGYVLVGQEASADMDKVAAYMRGYAR